MISTVYYWSPAEDFDSIRKFGLQKKFPDQQVFFSLSPSVAWAAAGGSGAYEEDQEWDLWQVQISDEDAICVLSGKLIRHLWFMNETALLPNRLWWVARRVSSEIL